MKICQIGTIGFKSSENKREIKTIGGIQGYILDLVQHILSSGHNLIFVGKIYFYKDVEDLEYIEVQKKVTSTNKFLINLFYKSFFMKLKSDTVIHAHRPDHLFVFTFFRRKNPSVLTIHGQQAVTVNLRKKLMVRKLYSFMEKGAIKRADYILATDKITQRYYEKHYPKYKSKISVSPTGVNLELFRPMDKTACRLEQNISETAKVILYLGRVEAPKRVKDIVEAFALLKKSKSDVKLIIVGDGNDLPEIKSFVKKEQIDQDINFMGAVMRENLPTIINCADISVLYSYNEGSPLSVKESLACGIPVIANPVGDVSEVIADKYNGFIFNGQTNEELSDLFSTALNSAEELKENCILSVKPFSKEAVFSNLIDIYKKLSSEK